MDLNSRKAARWRFLRQVFEETTGNSAEPVHYEGVAKKLEMSIQTADQVVQYLVAEGLLEWVAMGGFIGITHWGVKEVEKALEDPEVPTQHFPAMNVMYVGSMHNSNVQLGTVESRQVFQQTGDMADMLREFSTDLLGRISELGLARGEEHDLRADVEALRAQSAKSNLSPHLVREILNSVRVTLEGAAGNVIASGFLQRVSEIGAFFG